MKREYNSLLFLFIAQLFVLSACSSEDCPQHYEGENCDDCVYGYHKEADVCVASDPKAGDHFGRSVSVSGEWAIVGSPLEDGNIGDPYQFGDEPGATYIYRLESGEWVEKQKLTPSDAQTRCWFGSSVSISGDIAIIGTSACGLSGAAYIYQLENGQWIEKQKLVGSDLHRASGFGMVVSISGDIAIIGAPLKYAGEGDSLDDAGAAYIFQREGGQWIEKQMLTASDAQPDDYFGWSVSISGDVAIAGAPWKSGDNGDSIEEAGAAYLFQRESGQWVEKKKLIATIPQEHNYFGWSVSISGEVAIVGAINDDWERVHNAGAAYLFQLENGNWVQKQQLTASDAKDHANFGHSVSISGNVAIVGVPEEDGDSRAPLDRDGPGAAYIFQRESGQWVEKVKLTASDAQAQDGFGDSVSIDGDVAIIGVPQEDGDLAYDSNCGAAYIFQQENDDWLQTRKLQASVSLR